MYKVNTEEHTLLLHLPGGGGRDAKDRVRDGEPIVPGAVP